MHICAYGLQVLLQETRSAQWLHTNTCKVTLEWAQAEIGLPHMQGRRD